MRVFLAAILAQCFYFCQAGEAAALGIGGVKMPPYCAERWGRLQAGGGTPHSVLFGNPKDPMRKEKLAATIKRQLHNLVTFDPAAAISGRNISLGEEKYSEMSGPVVIGGMGDSGTRGVRDALAFLGVEIPHAPGEGHQADNTAILEYVNDASSIDVWPQVDASLRTDPLQDETLHELQMRQGGLFSVPRQSNLYVPFRKLKGNAVKPVGRTELIYDADPYSAHIELAVNHSEVVHSELNRDLLCVGMNELLRTLGNNWKEREYEPEKGGRKVAWGFKLPETILLIREWEELYPGTLKMVHVIRDGRDVARPHQLQHMAVRMCRHYFDDVPNNTSKPWYPNHLSGKFVFKPNTEIGAACLSGASVLRAWAAGNLAFRRVGKQLLGERFITVRIEDIALDEDPRPSLTRLAQFIGTDASYQLIEDAVKLVGGHSKSYGGNKNSAQEELNYLKQWSVRKEDALTPGSAILMAFQTFGYKLHEWGLAERHWTATTG
jgi:hypothetical protein